LNSSRSARGRGRRAGVIALIATFIVAVATVAVPAAAHKGKPKKHAGFKTSQAAMLDPAVPGATVEPLITVGETLPGSTYRFESIPDGISLLKGHGHTVHAYVNHETSTVPFPFTPATGVGFNDFTNALLSKLTLRRREGGVLSGEYVIQSEANYQRFCSNFLASKKHGFERPLLFTNEEATDFVYRTGEAWPINEPADPRTPEQAGVVVAYDVRTGQYRTIYGMGRHNHENSVALERYGRPVVLSTDDTFSAPGSQLYMYLADSADAVWNDRGSLWAFVSDDPATNDYGDLTGTESVSGRFIPVPRDIAVGEQTPLENWSNANNVFQFIRLEDIAYDRRHKNIVYIADTGEPRAQPDPATGRLRRGGAVPPNPMGPYPNGRIFKFVFDRNDPTKVESLSILIDGDSRGAAGAGALDLIHQPDNVETTKDLLLFQEDPGSHNQYPLGTGTTARIWAYNLRTGGDPYVVARVNQSADEGPTDKDASPTKAPAGAWESSGIIDASKFFGKGAFLVDIQAGTLIVEEEQRGTLTYQREGGQLLLFRLPRAKGMHDHGDHKGREKGRGKGKGKGRG
jgi:hypothetical protein